MNPAFCDVCKGTGIEKIGNRALMCNACSLSSKDIAIRRETWLAQRATTIGASDAAAILDVSPWGSALETWGRKKGVVPSDLEDPDGRLEAGRRAEGFVLDWYAELRERTCRLAAQYHSLQMKDYPFLTATPDAYDLSRDYLIEIKTASDYAANDWRAGPPIYYQVQVQHQLMVTGAKGCTLVACIGYHRPKYWDYTPNEEFQAALLKTLTAWYEEHMVKGTMPEPNGTKGAQNVLKVIHPTDTGKLIHIPDKYGAHWERMDGIKEELKKLEAEKILVSNQVKSVMGDAAYAMLPDGKVFQWKSRKGGTRPFIILNSLPEGVQR